MERRHPYIEGSKQRAHLVRLVGLAVGLALAVTSEVEARASESLTVAISPSRPWAFFDPQSPDAEPPRGFNVDLWLALAQDLDVQTAWRFEGAARKVFVAVHRGQADVGLVGFPEGALQLGPAILVPADPPFSDPARIAQRIARLLSFRAILYPLLVFLFAVHVRWVVDRLAKPESREFPSSYFEGVGESAWRIIGLLLDFGVSTSRSWLTRLFDLAWHLLGLVLLSGFVGVLTAIVTLETAAQRIQSLEDVRGKKIAVVKGSLGNDQLLRRLGIESPTLVGDVNEALGQLRRGKVDAVLGSRVALSFAAKQANMDGGIKVEVLPDSLGRQRYAVIMRPGHPRKAAVDRLLGQLHLPRGLEASVSARLEAKWGIGVR